MQRKVGFLVIGVQKAGTTSLDQYLRLHPDIAMPRGIKELHFFDKFFQKGQDYYHSFFSEATGKKLWGECSPIYIYWEGVLQKIKEYNPDVKLILILRNPVERAFSHWNMEYTHHRESLSFHDALVAEKGRLEVSDNRQHRVYSYVDRGRYVGQIKTLWHVFNQKKVHILKMDDLVTSPEITMNEIFTFLGLQQIKLNNQIRAYTGDYKQLMSTGDRDYLLSCFKDEVLSLEKLLGWDCSSWLE